MVAFIFLSFARRRTSFRCMAPCAAQPQTLCQDQLEESHVFRSEPPTVDGTATTRAEGVVRCSHRNTPSLRVRIQAMGKGLTADDILPLIAALTPDERARLLQLIASPERSAESVYAAKPPRRDEFSSDDESLAWEAEGWENIG